MLLGELKLAARIRVLVAAAELDKERCGAGKLALHLGLGEAGVAAELHELSSEGRVVAHVAKENGSHFAVGREHAEDRYFVIHRTGGIDADGDAAGLDGAAVGGKSGLTVVKGQ